jgi:hypothetical protein
MTFGNDTLVSPTGKGENTRYKMQYNGFLSYSHAADSKLAPAVQSALHRFARPWYRLRSVWIFRDKTGLAVTPSLWGTIEKALSESEYFLLMAWPTGSVAAKNYSSVLYARLTPEMCSRSAEGGIGLFLSQKYEIRCLFATIRPQDHSRPSKRRSVLYARLTPHIRTWFAAYNTDARGTTWHTAGIIRRIYAQEMTSKVISGGGVSFPTPRAYLGCP